LKRSRSGKGTVGKEKRLGGCFQNSSKKKLQRKKIKARVVLKRCRVGEGDEGKKSGGRVGGENENRRWGTKKDQL